MPWFVRDIMQFQEDEELLKSFSDVQPQKKSDVQQDALVLKRTESTIDRQIEKRIRASVKLIIELKKLFAFLAKSDKKYADPTGVLNSIVDDYGNTVQVGEQKDMAEFNNNFLARVQEGLHARLILTKLQKEAAKEQTQEEVKSGDAAMLNQAEDRPMGSEEVKTHSTVDQDITMIDTAAPKVESAAMALKRV